MAPQSGQTSEFKLPPHLHFSRESCPACGQTIPPDKLEEISGKIATRERERALAITAQLEKQYAIGMARADAKAQADLESEREQSAAREVRMRQDDREAAEKLLAERLEEANRDRQKLVDGLQQQIEKVESERRSAEQTRAHLHAEMDELRRTSATALEAVEADAKRCEIEIRNDARLNAEAAAAERIQAMEAARRESEATLQAKINEAKANSIAAEQDQTALKLRIEKLQEANEAEVAKVKEDAAKEAVRIHQLATEKAELRYRDTLAAQERAVVESNAKAREAEKHASEIEHSLGVQREIMEQAKEDALNAEKARAFEENQKLSTKVNDLQRALEKKTNEELGEGAEINVYEALRAEFRDDRIERIPKGAPGADIRHVVNFRGQECGTILYDSKNHNQWRDEHAAKLRRDQLAEKAEHSILSTHKFPRGAHQLHSQDGVLLANPARVVSVARIVRQHLIQMHTLRLSKIERESKTAVLYEFITSEHCRQLLDRIDERAGSLLELQEKEMRWHQTNWKHQGTAIRTIQKAKSDLASEIDTIIGTSTDMSEVS